MARLPQVGGDAGNWGEILNEYLAVAHKADGTIADDSVGTSQLKSNSISNSAIISGTITENKLAISNNPSTGNLLSWDGTDLTWTAPATLSAVATSGSYTDLTNKPSIPTDSTLVHLTGAETISGNKDFTGSLTQNGNAIVTTVDGRLSDTRTPTDNTVSSAKIQDGAVTTAKIPDGAITNAKLATNVQTMMTDTQTAASNAATSATNAGNSATAAANSATAANTSATNASTSATNASSAQTAAESARDETIVAVDGQTSWTGAVTLSATQSKSKYVRRLLTGNTTVTVAAGDSGKAYSCTLELQQDSTGSRTIVLANVATPYGVALPLSTTANNVDVLRLEWNGTRWAGYVGGPQMSIPSAWVV